MATVNQIYAMVNDSAKEALGESAIAVKDTATLVSLGDVVLSSDDNKEAAHYRTDDPRFQSGFRWRRGIQVRPDPCRNVPYDDS